MAEQLTLPLTPKRGKMTNVEKTSLILMIVRHQTEITKRKLNPPQIKDYLVEVEKPDFLIRESTIRDIAKAPEMTWMQAFIRGGGNSPKIGQGVKIANLEKKVATLENEMDRLIGVLMAWAGSNARVLYGRLVSSGLTKPEGRE